ncbi:type III secretion system export apparatus subunit SctT [Marinibactrum halimedae]|uniref:EscT/YscT/HrcT family type III secretion system export apparatus protein n=1 Tax=Marinibactrum halimedae TaxID=1444977 RepID=A0AA37T420_9GAMM|nr:type III secretion system export apparatus subunit SctT [Marinibactrum halimedae]MCD9459076.1 type III secretion system export apparatus subunit SctT [Marinibactrum halimedae]GLS24677.1 EscT/YscT/HrcT family type III secretion system export apparatus protein [Marinibactrum halimedae]
MDWNISDIDTMIETYSLALPRVYVVFTILPIMSKTLLGGAMVRNGILLSLSLFMFPLNEGTLETELSKLDYLSILLKEAVIGLVIGLVIAIPFWIAEGVGFIIDNQRGSTMGNMVNPLSGDETSPLGVFLSQLLNTFFIISGAFLLMMGVIYQSYVYWPIGKMIPLDLTGTDVFIFSQLDFLMRSIILFSAPVVIAMFLSEFTLALISRFAPQLNVFFLAMPIKSIVGIFILILYVKLLMGNIDSIVESTFDDMYTFMQQLQESS